MKVFRHGEIPSSMPTLSGAIEDLLEHLLHGNDGNPWCKWTVSALENNTFWVTQLQHSADRQLIFDIADVFDELCRQNEVALGKSGYQRWTLTVLIVAPLEGRLEQIVQDTRLNLWWGLCHPCRRYVHYKKAGADFRIEHLTLS